MKTLRLILGDQLNYHHSWFDPKSDDIIYTLMEVKPETAYAKHHIQKVVGFFAAMRNFAEWLDQQGHQVRYFKIGDEDNEQSFEKNIKKIIKENEIEKFEYQYPDEYRLDELLKDLAAGLDIESVAVDSEHFLAERMDVKDFFEDKKQYLLESFYRDMRKKHDILMNGEKPEGGEWNYDEENRSSWDGEAEVPEAFPKTNDVSDILTEIKDVGIKTIGEVNDEEFSWPISREQSLEVLEHFCENKLHHFGTYQDALSLEHDFLFHSLLSFALNTKQISPLEVVKRTIKEWGKREDEISLSQIEGFVRQIIGWREFMRGVYWAHMPDYASKNFFEHKNKLPEFYWTGDTKMSCLKKSVNASLKNAYAHHIQRLMITGNFALLAQVDPDEVDEWYLGIYIDAIEWVEITNTRGMSQFADGGIVGTKPYMSSANYIDKMGDYCSACHYHKSKKTGEKACPFNSLYWNFFDTHREKLEKNARVGMMLSTWDRMGGDKQSEILEQAQGYLENLDNL